MLWQRRPYLPLTLVLSTCDQLCAGGVSQPCLQRNIIRGISVFGFVYALSIELLGRLCLTWFTLSLDIELCSFLHTWRRRGWWRGSPAFHVTTGEMPSSSTAHVPCALASVPPIHSILCVSGRPIVIVIGGGYCYYISGLNLI
jgi:hypothetical protein